MNEEAIAHATSSPHPEIHHAFRQAARIFVRYDVVNGVENLLSHPPQSAKQRRGEPGGPLLKMHADNIRPPLQPFEKLPLAADVMHHPAGRPRKFGAIRISMLQHREK